MSGPPAFRLGAPPAAGTGGAPAPRLNAAAAAPASAPPALEVGGLSVYYGPVRGVSGVSLEVQQGEVVALLGANGAGKSTVLKAVSGIVKPRSGTVRFWGRDVTAVKASERAKMGLVQVPEGRRIFPALTVRENLELASFGSQVREGGGERRRGARDPFRGTSWPSGGLWPRRALLLGGAFGLGGASRRQARLEAVVGRFPLLKPHLGKLAGMLSGGEQQVLAIARAMMADPKVLMVDEPSLGLAPQMVESVYELLSDIGKGGTSVLLVEQNVSLAFEVTERAYVLQNGSLVLSGPSSELASDPRVVDAYLGAAVKDGTLSQSARVPGGELAQFSGGGSVSADRDEPLHKAAPPEQGTPV